MGFPGHRQVKWKNAAEIPSSCHERIMLAGLVQAPYFKVSAARYLVPNALLGGLEFASCACRKADMIK